MLTAPGRGSESSCRRSHHVPAALQKKNAPVYKLSIFSWRTNTHALSALFITTHAFIYLSCISAQILPWLYCGATDLWQPGPSLFANQFNDVRLGLAGSRTGSSTPRTRPRVKLSAGSRTGCPLTFGACRSPSWLRWLKLMRIGHCHSSLPDDLLCADLTHPAPHCVLQGSGHGETLL